MVLLLYGTVTRYTVVLSTPNKSQNRAIEYHTSTVDPIDYVSIFTGPKLWAERAQDS